MTLPEIKRKDKRTLLDKEIDRLLEKMADIDDQTSEGYLKCQASLEKLLVLKGKKEPKKEPRKRIDPNVLVAAGTEIGLGFAIMHYEKLGIITSKVFGRLPRMIIR